jgi:hypothetical protein
VHILTGRGGTDPVVAAGTALQQRLAAGLGGAGIVTVAVVFVALLGGALAAHRWRVSAGRPGRPAGRASSS